MPSSYSPNLKIELVNTGSQEGLWGQTLNTNFSQALEQAIVGEGVANFPSNSNLTLTFLNAATSQIFRNVKLRLTSSVTLTANRDLNVPAINKVYHVTNNTSGGRTINVGPSAGTKVPVPNGATVSIYVDGTNATFLADHYRLRSYVEGEFTITDGASVVLNPNNGSMQLWTLGANRTPSAANWENGQSMLLLINAGASNTVSWGTVGVQWKTDSGAAPTLLASGFTPIALWRMNGVIYGARVGDA